MGDNNRTPRKRKLTKKVSRPTDVTIEELPCISGGWQKEKIALPIKKREGRSPILNITTRTHWLYNLLSGPKARPRSEKLISKVLEDISSVLQEAGGATANM
jgi:hypothetical protein